MPRVARYGLQGEASVWPWIAFLVVSSLLLSRSFACATPFVALATLGALTLRSRDAVVVVLAVWLGNQLIGFGVMHYPWTASTFGWGLAIGLGALAAWAAAGGVIQALPRGGMIAVAPALVGAFSAYELVLFAATAFLPSGRGVFAAPVILRIFAINAVALALLIAAQRLASTAGLKAGQLPSLSPV